MRENGSRFILVILVLSLGLTVVPPVQAHQTWTIVTGGGVKDTSVVSNSFRPRAIEIAVGDTVRWEFQRPWQVHTVTFLSGQQPPEFIVREGDKTYHNPQIFFPLGGKTYDGTGIANSGFPPDLSKPFSYSLTFTKAGTFDYLCLLHGPPMSGKVIVKERAAASPSSVKARGRSELAATIKAGQAAFAGWKTERKDKTVVLPLIGNPQQGWSILRFSRNPVVIDLGTTVTWTIRDPLEIHTVTFTSGQKPPEFVVVEPQKQGPPKLLLPAQAATPTQAKTYEGKGYANSGILFPPGIPGNPPTSFSLTFTKAGSYEYLCLVHAQEGMKGTIIVK